MTSFFINAPSRAVIIQSNTIDFTNLHKFLTTTAVSFLFRCRLPPFWHDPSIFEWTIKSIPALSYSRVIDIIDLIFKIFIFLVYYARECNFYGVVFVNFFYCTYQFLCIFYNDSIVLQAISACMNYRNVRIFTYSWLKVVSQVLRWCPMMRSNFNWIPTRYIPFTDVFYHLIPIDNNILLFYFWQMSQRMKIFKTIFQFFQSTILSNIWLIPFMISKVLCLRMTPIFSLQKLQCCFVNYLPCHDHYYLKCFRFCRF